MKPCLLIILCFCLNLSFAQNGTPLPASARGMGMGNTGVAASDANSIFSNPAGLAFISGTQFSLFGEQRFAGTGINNMAVGASHTVGPGTFGLMVQYFGISDYNEQKVGLSYARKLFEKLSLGVQFDYINTRIREYGNAGVFTFELGFSAPLNKEITVGGRIFSPMRVSLTEGEELPGVLGVGFSYTPSKKVTFNGEVEKSIENDLVIRAGIEYQLHPVVAIRVGGNANPTLATFGAGFKINENFHIDVATSYHQVLGISPGFGVRYGLGGDQILK